MSDKDDSTKKPVETPPMSDTPKLDRLQRAEAEILIERISSDGQALEDFVFAAIYFRAKAERALTAAQTELAKAKERCGKLENVLRKLRAETRVICEVNNLMPDDTAEALEEADAILDAAASGPKEG